MARAPGRARLAALLAPQLALLHRARGEGPARREACPLLPQGAGAGTWAELLSAHARGHERALVVCAPRGALAPARPPGPGRPGEGAAGAAGAAGARGAARQRQGVAAARAAAPHAPLAGACVLLLAAEACRALRPGLVPAPPAGPASGDAQLPAVLLFHGDGGRWRPHRRSRFSGRRMNNCGLQAECLLLDLADVALSQGLEGPRWASLGALWPGAPKLRRPDGAPGGASARAHPFSLVASPFWSSGGAGASIPQCLLGFMREVIRLRPAADGGEASATREPPALLASGSTAAAPILVLHYTKLSLRKSLMQQRLKAAGAESQSLFLEMEPDYVNDSMRHCLGPHRRKSIDSMSENPTWRYPTRGEDSLALKHLAAAVWLIESRWPHVLILEDDAWFSQHLVVDLASLLEEVRLLDWDVVAVGTCYHHRTPFGHQVLPHVWFTQIMPCAHAYLLSRKGARAILETLPLQLPIDLQISTLAQDGAPYDELRRGRWAPGRARAEVFWAEPQLAFQWPPDALRSVEAGAAGDAEA